MTPITCFASSNPAQSFSRNSFTSFVSHSQITIARQPSSVSRSTFALSLATFWANLFDQNSTCVLGVVAFEQPGCLCQKHPCTKTATRYRGNTMSGLPAISLRCKRKRYPSQKRNRRTTISGPVSFLPTRDINQDRRWGVNRSAIVPSIAGFSNLIRNKSKREGLAYLYQSGDIFTSSL